nr:hypothetical protein [Tanacetum cinerariifolium]
TKELLPLWRDALRSTNGDDSHNSKTGVRRTERTTRECTYIDFLKCQPSPFKGTKGVASLSQWFERIESVFHINNCAIENQVKFATCTLHSELALLYWRMFSEESDKIEKYIEGLHDMIHGSVVASKPKTMRELKNNNNHGNQGGRNNAPAKVYAVGRVGIDPDANVVTEKYMMKEFPVFLAHITTKEVEEKSEKKRLEDVPIV